MSLATDVSPCLLIVPRDGRRANGAPRAARARDRDGLLFRRYIRHHDRRAREELIERKLPLARALARRYAGGRAEREDLAQVAALGLIKAIDRFDPERGTAFTSFAVPTITGELRRHLRDTAWAVHVPRGMQEVALELMRLSAELASVLGRSPSPGELADASGRPVEEVLEALEARHGLDADSLDAPVQAEDGTTPHERFGSVDDDLELVVSRATVQSAVGRLPERERELLRLRFEEQLTQREIGDRIGVSQMHVSRLLRRALDRVSTLAAA
jgi:RNA polymerase sigma-B factor